MAAVDVLHRHGLTLSTRKGRLIVSPRDRLTDDLRGYIRQHKAAILAELDADPRHSCADCLHLTPTDGRCLAHYRGELAGEPGWFCSRVYRPDLARRRHCGRFQGREVAQ